METAGGSTRYSTETLHLVAHSGRLFAATGQWMSGSGTGGSILVKGSATSGWQTFLATDSLRVTALESFAIPARANRGASVDVMLTSAAIDGRQRLMWWRGDAEAVEGSFDVGPAGYGVRALGARREGGGFAFYAGVDPTGVLRGTWNPQSQSIDWSAAAELQVEQAADRKVTGFAECAGAMWVTIRHRLFRRNDGPLPAGVPRWALAVEAPIPGPENSGLRGLTCMRHRGNPALLVSIEGPGTILRLENLPKGVTATPTVTQVVEAEPRAVITDELARPACASLVQGSGRSATSSWPTTSSFRSTRSTARHT